MTNAQWLAVDECNCNALRKAARRVSQFYDSKLAPTGLRITQVTILVILRELKDVSVNELAKHLDLDRTTTGKNLRPLERAELVTVVPAPSDRRSRRVVLTAKGEIALKAAGPLWREAQREFELANGREASAALRSQLFNLKVGAANTHDPEVPACEVSVPPHG